MRFEIYQDVAGEWRWRHRARNGRITADSGEGYATKSNCLRAVRRFKLRHTSAWLSVIRETKA